MKKFLAIVLSIVMVLGVCSISVFAFDETELTAMPTQKDNCIYFAAGDIKGAEADKQYEIPVYMISKYPTQIQDGFVQLGFEVYLSNTNIASIVKVEFADEIKALNGFVPLEAYYGYTDADYEVTTYHMDFDKGYVAFAAGLEALNQAKVKVCTVTIETNDKFIGGANYDKETTKDFVNLYIGGYNFNETVHGNYFDVTGGGIFEGAIPGGYYDSNEEVSPAEEIALGTAQVDNGIYFRQSAVYHYEAPDKPEWLTPLIDWFSEQVEQFFQICDTVREYVRLIVGLLYMI